jgi:ADP-heptose:LPS heptosyltransferase
VVIVPFCDDPRIEWPTGHWQRLIWLLRARGYDVVAIGERDHAQEFSTKFQRNYAFWASGPSTDWTLDVLLGAEAVIAPHCGLAYVAALHGVRTLCLCAEYPEEYFFRELGMEIVQSDAPCTGCWRDEQNGYLESCRLACTALGAIIPERVVDHFLKPKVQHES